MKIEPQNPLQHTLLNSVGSTGSVITYEFRENNHVKTVHAQEDFTNPIDDQQYKEAAEVWETAFRALEDVAERQDR